MKKKYTKQFILLLTSEQEKSLNEKIERLGFSNKSDYVRFMIFMELSFIEKIDQIHKNLCGEDVTES